MVSEPAGAGPQVSAAAPERGGLAALEGWDAVVVGGGFYGTALALYLRRRRKRARVLLIEQADRLFAHASYNNQARVHGGYHYPRSFTTAYRSRVNLPRFLADFAGAVHTDVTAIYAIARRNSLVSARQFQRFTQAIGARLQPLPRSWQSLFDPLCIEAAFVVEEQVFDAAQLALQAQQALAMAGVEVRLATRVVGVHRAAEGLLIATRGAGVTSAAALGCAAEQPGVLQLHTQLLLNCTYAGLGQLGGEMGSPQAALKHELAEIALVRVPPQLAAVGITVMDGPFFSLQPFPDRGLHSLTHVRYTPHVAWPERAGDDPYARLASYPRASRYDRMQRDVVRYVPALQAMQHESSLYEIKTVLQKNETDDGRPILIERHAQLPGCISVLGGKLDNVYDVLERLDAERLPGD